MQLKNWKGRKMNQSILPSYFVPFPEFKSTLMKWMITTYQPLLVTSISKTGYVTCTAHFIDKDIWKIQSMILGLI